MIVNYERLRIRFRVMLTRRETIIGHWRALVNNNLLLSSCIRCDIITSFPVPRCPTIDPTFRADRSLLYCSAGDADCDS